MQLATVKDGKPWVCTVWFVADEQGNIYWESRKTRRHSQELSENPYVSAAIVKTYQRGRGEKVMGLQLEGKARIVEPGEIEKAYSLYLAKYPQAPTILEEIKKSDAPTAFYVVKPDTCILFDEVNFPDNPRQEITL